MLDIICDNRTGEKLELIIPVKNEEKRMLSVLEYYKKSDVLDLVIFDDNSTDASVEIALKLKATVYKKIGNEVLEKYFVYYTNKLTRSERCFFLAMDEYISMDNLLIVGQHLENKTGVVLGKRIDYFFNKPMKTLRSSTPRGFLKGWVEYNHKNLHAALKINPFMQHNLHNIEIPVLHLQVWSMVDTFGKCGFYTQNEINGLLSEKNWSWLFFKRFLLSPIYYLVTRSWREDKRRCLFFLMLKCVDLPIALLLLMEHFWFPDKQTQIKYYNQFFSKQDSTNSIDG